VVQMDRAVAEAARTVIVLSPAFLNSVFGRAEWTATLAADPDRTEGKLVPVRVSDCHPTGLLKQLVYIDLVGIGDEAAARRVLLTQIKPTRLKPSQPPHFPPAPKVFPAAETVAPFEFNSCFLCYSSRDQAFAERLHADLQNQGVRCWFAAHDIVPGRKLHEQINDAIRLHDHLVLILSEASMASHG
jgi:TIR domain